MHILSKFRSSNVSWFLCCEGYEAEVDDEDDDDAEMEEEDDMSVESIGEEDDEEEDDDSMDESSVESMVEESEEEEEDDGQESVKECTWSFYFMFCLYHDASKNAPFILLL